MDIQANLNQFSIVSIIIKKGKKTYGSIKASNGCQHYTANGIRTLFSWKLVGIPQVDQCNIKLDQIQYFFIQYKFMKCFRSTDPFTIKILHYRVVPAWPVGVLSRKNDSDSTPYHNIFEI